MKLMLAHMIEKPKLDEEFKQWPLHITLVPWFNVKVPVDELLAKIDTLLSEQQSFSVYGGERIKLGFAKKVPVFLLEKNSQLRSAHKQLLNILNASGVSTNGLRHVGDKFTPHVTDRKEVMHLKGVELTVDSVDLVQSISEWPRKSRKSIYRFEFKR